MIPTLSVSQFLEQINEIIAGEFVIEGEVGECRVAQNKWIFFDLKDEKSVLNCFATVYAVRVALEEGMKARVTGYPKIYEKSGRFSLVVQQVELVGEGALKRALFLLKKKLEAEGLFDLARKRPLPEFPAKIGVIASRESAGWGDFKRIISNRWGGLEISLCHTAVQGADAVKDIMEAFQKFNSLSESERPEAIALIRGGGSQEDLAAFNTEEVARAIYGSKAPVISGVGHERDETIADLVADVRASTPSNAAEMLAPDKSEFISQLDFTLDHLRQTLTHQLTVCNHNIVQAFNIISGKVEAPLAKCRLLVDSFAGLLGRVKDECQYKKEAVLSNERLLQSFNPGSVLGRGYSITRDLAGKIVRSADQVDAGAGIVVELSKGKIEAEVVRATSKRPFKQSQLTV